MMGPSSRRTTGPLLLTVLAGIVGVLAAAGCTGGRSTVADRSAHRAGTGGTTASTEAAGNTATVTSTSASLFPAPTPFPLDDVRIPRVRDIVPVVFEGPTDQRVLRQAVTFRAPPEWDGQTTLSPDGGGQGLGPTYAYAADSDDGSAKRSVVVAAGPSCGGDRTIASADGTPWRVETSADGKTVFAHSRPIDGCLTVALHGLSPAEATDVISRTDSAEPSTVMGSDTTVLPTRAPSWLPDDLRPHWRSFDVHHAGSTISRLVGRSGRVYRIVRSSEAASPAIDRLAMQAADVGGAPAVASRCESQGPTTVCAWVSSDGSLVLSASRDGARVDVTTSNADGAADPSDALARMGEIVNHLSP